MDWKEAADDQVVCYCMNVTKKEIADAVNEGAASVQAVARKTGATGGCGACVSSVSEVVSLYK